MDEIRFSDFTMHRRTRRLAKGGEDVSLGARAFDLLDFLISRRDGVATRDEIMSAVWPQAIVGENNLNVQVANLRRILGPDAIATVPGRGLRFALEISGEEPAGLNLPDRPSIVVLPFSNLGTVSDLAWLAVGFTEDITTELSRFRDLFVVARNTALAFQSEPRDLGAISRELGVRYVVEGSVRAAPDRVRISAHLIDATNGRQVWSESFDSALTDHFETQAQVAHAIVTCLAPQISRAESERGGATIPEDLTAHGLAIHAWSEAAAADMVHDKEPRDRGATLAKQALERDPGSSLAWRVLAWVAWGNAYHGTTDSIGDTLAEGIAAATMAIEADSADHHARRLRALLNFMNQDPETGLSELRQAHEMNPNCSTTMAWLGLYEALHGNPVRGVPLSESALRHSPRDPARGSHLATLGFAQFASRDYEAAAASAKFALAEAAGSVVPLVLSTIANVAVGRMDLAVEAYQKLETIAPTLVEARLSGRWLATNPDYFDRAHLFFRIAAGLEPPEAAENLR